MKIHVLGTGNAGVTECYNTCFSIENNGEHFLVDCGGGNQIHTQLKKAKIEYKDINHVFVSHTHIDHILGILWFLRWKIDDAKIFRKVELNDFNIYGNEIVINAIKQISNTLLSKRHLQNFDKVNFVTIKDGDTKQVLGMKVRFFDTIAKDLQHGFDINDNLVVFAGDKPLHKDNFDRFKSCEWLLHEAFCLDTECGTLDPYSKGHCSVKDASITAQEINAKNLIIWHTHDNSLATRKKDFTKEARQYFKGNVLVPCDIEIVKIK